MRNGFEHVDLRHRIYDRREEKRRGTVECQSTTGKEEKIQTTDRLSGGDRQSTKFFTCCLLGNMKIFRMGLFLPSFLPSFLHRFAWKTYRRSSLFMFRYLSSLECLKHGMQSGRTNTNTKENKMPHLCLLAYLLLLFFFFFLFFPAAMP